MRVLPTAYHSSVALADVVWVDGGHMGLFVERQYIDTVYVVSIGTVHQAHLYRQVIADVERGRLRLSGQNPIDVHAVHATLQEGNVLQIDDLEHFVTLEH